MNNSPYKISGRERRELKKEVRKLKMLIKSFWHFEGIDRVYGGGLADEEAQMTLNKWKAKLKVMETKLEIPAQ